MIEFEPIQLEHKAKIQNFLKQDNVPATERNFACLYIWGKHYGTEVYVNDKWCCVRFKGENDNYYYCPPLGEVDVLEAVRSIAEIQNGKPLYFTGLTDKQAKQFSDALKEKCTITYERDISDYIYNADNLRTLPGKKYSAKRNHINKFEKLYGDNWLYRNIDFENDTQLLMDFHSQWCLAKEQSGQSSEEYRHEYCAILRAMKDYEFLELKGGILFVEGKVAAYTLAAPTSEDTMDILIEKGDVNVHGAYAVINKEFANSVGEQYKLFNREEDLGIEGLRKAKLSYYPEFLVEKHMAEIKL